MKPGISKYGRRILLGSALLAMAAWLVPSFFSAERYRRRLETGLERTLRRPVTFGAISFCLLPRPSLEIQNAVVREDPAFGSEPFARVDKIQCDLAWRSLWRSRLEFSTLRLAGANFNVVRNTRGKWNVEDFLQKSGIVAPRQGAAAYGRVESAASLQLGLEEARINFKIGADKKSFAVTGVRGNVSFDPQRRSLQFRLIGSPIRAGLSFPTPGPVELTGEWSPGDDLEGPLKAALRTQRGLLYDWIPLVTGRNPEIYGVVDTNLNLSGSIRDLRVEGEGRLSQIHRWEQIPPSDSLACRIYVRGQVNRKLGRAMIDTMDAFFADSRVHLSGSIDGLGASPEVDLVLAVGRSRGEDLLALGRRFSGHSNAFGLSGRVDGLLTIQGPWTHRRYGGFVAVHEARLTTPRGTYPVSDVAVRIDNRAAWLAPVTLNLAPHVELLTEGFMKRQGGIPRYELEFSAKGVPLKEVISFARAVGVQAAQGVDAQGMGSGTFQLGGSLWPLTRPALTGHADLRAARLLIAGLTEPLHIPRARIQVNSDRVIIDPVVAVIGTSIFSGRIEHQGERKEPWRFEVRANNLSVDQGARWFDALGLERPQRLLDRLPGLSPLGARRTAASNLFAALNAKGRFVTPEVTYRSVTLKDFQSTVEISGRVIRLAGTKFRAAEGYGQGKVQLDLNSAPARISGDLELSRANVKSFKSVLPGVFQDFRGVFSGSGRFETRGLRRQEMSASLFGDATLQLKNISFGSFDPLDALVRRAEAGALEPAQSEVSLRSAAARIEVRDRHVFVRSFSLDLSGAKVRLAGSYGFEGAVDFDVKADLRRLRRRWLNGEGENHPLVNLRLTGPADNLAIAPEAQASHLMPK